MLSGGLFACSVGMTAPQSLMGRPALGGHVVCLLCGDDSAPEFDGQTSTRRPCCLMSVFCVEMTAPQSDGQTSTRRPCCLMSVFCVEMTAPQSLMGRPALCGHVV